MSESIFESEKFINLMKNEEFIKEICSKKEKEEIVDAFDNHGIKMEDKDLEKFADMLEKIYIGNVSGGKKFSEAVGDFIDKHPWLTFFTATSALVAVPQTIAAIRGTPLTVRNYYNVNNDHK